MEGEKKGPKLIPRGFKQDERGLVPRFQHHKAERAYEHLGSGQTCQMKLPTESTSRLETLEKRCSSVGISWSSAKEDRRSFVSLALILVLVETSLSLSVRKDDRVLA